ncbi:MAG: exo-alpha-sialidase [Planctomycetes bacterium]|nr:exo-alpha-sialidase [Planctomycetota bacterium]
MAARLLVTVGTKKGLFVLEGSKHGRRFDVHGPYFPGLSVNATLFDRRGTPRIVAAASSPWFGCGVHVAPMQLAKGGGPKWKATGGVPAFAKDDASARTLKQIWSLAEGPGKRDWFCGVEPAALFHSEDGGKGWQPVASFNEHPHAKSWSPGAGGLCLHTILPSKDAFHVAVSTGGHYCSRDGRATFKPENKGIDAHFNPDRNPEYGQCVHKIAAHPSRPERLYAQNHGGAADRQDLSVLRSDDGGRTWTSIAKGLPSDFGFPIVVHPDQPDTIYVVPLETATRTCPGGKPTVWRSEDAGETWEPLRKGLPKKEAWYTVLRDAMSADDAKESSLWFGTTTGQLWRGRDGGDEWEQVVANLPPIHSVRAATV